MAPRPEANPTRAAKTAMATCSLPREEEWRIDFR